MNTLGISRLGAIAMLYCAHLSNALAVTFTHDAFISYADVSNEGQDIVVTNCTLTVDGPHTFNSLQLLNGGVLTHSALPYGPQQFTFSVFGEAHALSATNAATLNNTNVDTSTIEVMNTDGTIFYTENVDYIVTVSNPFIQLSLTTNSAIAEGATVLVDYDWAQNFQGFALTINGNANVATGAAINVSGKGYAGGIGANNGAGTSRTTNSPFVFTAGGGAGHGGAGGMSSTFARGGATYDSTTNPATLGSGGGTGSADGGAGGGAALLFVDGDFQIDGQILAGGFRGTNAHSGGGSGGSILISAEAISGAGSISANGGSGDTPDGGGGGGGRIAIYFGANNFSGNITAFGGGGANVGGAGTVYLQSRTDPAGQLFIVNGGKRGTNTTFSAAVSDLTISGGAVLQAPILPLSVTNLYVGSNSWLASLDSLPLTVTVSGNATLEANAVINADFKSSVGPGTATATGGCLGAGASYGGYGGMSACGESGGPVYGSISQPSNLGSPGNPAASNPRGGGAIKMTVAGALSLNGNISANGASSVASSSGGGSGGSVWLTVGTLAGAGTISANGGSASNLVSGGGGGGRVAVYFNTNSFTGGITAHGGAGTHSGGAGSIYLKPSNDIPQIVFDNGGLVGTTFSLEGLSNSELTITGGTVLTNLQAISLRSLFIGSNSWLTPFAYPQSDLAITATSATIQRGGGINSDAISASSSGAQSVNSIGGGGGNAGNGGTGSTNAAGGSRTVNHASPSTSGGVGGTGSGLGGRGGGYLSLTVSGALIMDGQISANGGAGALNSGGGAGGSIRLVAGTFSGAGIISANGGAGNNLGGGGGGGAIAIDSNTNLFFGSIVALGGSGSQFGGAGTIYKAPFQLSGKASPLIMDNGGNRGAATPLGATFDVSDLTITGGAVVSNSTPISQLANLLVGSNSVFQLFSPYTQGFTVSNATIQAGGSVNADGGNTFGTLGLGQTLNSSGGGGGGAGTGGASALGAVGGVAVSDSISLPLTPGGRGGNGALQNGTGGNGGGAIRFSVINTLRVDGKLSADGTSGFSLDSGGGAGGAISLSAKTLTGSGVISVNGGAGNFAGGGGGGGRIGISCTTNTFTGIMTARGGSGANFGGAGTVYVASGPILQSPIATQITLDNGGVVGGLTPLFTALQGNPSLTIKGGAILTNAIAPELSNLFIGSNSTWRATSPSIFNLTVLGNVTIEASGILAADATSNQGPNPGQSGGIRGGGGGGHGGYGGASFSNVVGGSVSSDSVTSPTIAGSAGGSGSGIGGGFGGGTLQMTVRGIMQLDGRLSADGGSNSSNLNSGGGSGGSVWLSVAKLSGAGTISANGGAANNLGGGGGGGRVAVWYNTNLFTGPVTARGGPGANFGGAGTVYLNPSMTGLRSGARVLIDNGGARGANTSLARNLDTADLIITNGACVNLGLATFGLPSWNNLTIASNSSLTLASNFTALYLVINSNFDLQAGGTVMLDGLGFGANAGPGAGFASSGQGGGAGHGGLGSAAANTNGGVSYDSIISPLLAGSGGGSLTPTSGSAGGGAAHLTVGGTCKINGVISANGTAAIVAGAGGGSGGSLLLTAGTGSGTGKISADGGDGDVFTSGGGAGGCISLNFKTNLFTGTISAHGGMGVGLAGGAGTIYLQTNSANFGQLIVDNAGRAGTTTPLSSQLPPVALSIRNRGEVDSATPLTLQSLSIGAGSGIISHSLVPLNITVLANALVDTNAIITADAAGYNAGSGLGIGNVDFAGDGSGGGYGGAGGASFYGAPGGVTYGLSNQPVDFGSSGGMAPILSGFSQGGGAVHLTVKGGLTMNGNISANGVDGFVDGAGGGSGGSIWILAQTLSGNGSFAADGGAGESFEGGGGGGGRIAIYATTNFFAGNISAMGGDGASPGQNGTIYVPTSFVISGVVTNLNGKGVPGIILQTMGLSSPVSDTNGFYSVVVPPYWSGSIIPSGNGVIFPSSRNYVGVSQDTPDQGFLVSSTSTLTINGASVAGNNFTINWFALNGVNYQLQYSTNLVDWIPVGPVYIGDDTPHEELVPTGNAPQMYFRMSSY